MGAGAVRTRPSPNAAKFIARLLPEPHETDLGGEPAHHLLATVHVDRVCQPSGHRIGWTDCYASADMLPVTWKADLLLEPNGEPKSIPAHLMGEARERAERTDRNDAEAKLRSTTQR